jgi:predicted dehydrogenase
VGVDVKFLVVGLGSMGKRRVRNLQALDQTDIAGYDPRSDRQDEARKSYGITTYTDFDEAISGFSPDVLIISTSPALHMQYAYFAFEKGLHCFIEASVVDADKILELHKQSIGGKILIAPSCTMRYFPGPKKVKELVQDNKIGKTLSFSYQTGQYLPDWHPWEKIEDYYVSKKETGACREIVPFELTWINDIFGTAEPLALARAKLSDMNADIDDIYHCLLRYPDNILANIIIEVLSRPVATRVLRILGSEGQIVFDADENCVRHIHTGMDDWKKCEFAGGTVEKGYINPEEPYISEMSDFVTAIQENDFSIYPNTLHDDYEVLQTLYGLEALERK